MYQPGFTSVDTEQLRDYLMQELNAIAREFSAAKPMLMLEMSYAAPSKPKDGMVVLADGTSWNPSAGGQGFYGYYGGSWKKLG